MQPPAPNLVEVNLGVQDRPLHPDRDWCGVGGHRGQPRVKGFGDQVVVQLLAGQYRQARGEHGLRRH